MAGRRSRIGAIGLALLVLATTPSAALAASSDWPARWISYGVRPVVAVDSNGRNHIAFLDLDRVRYATDASGSWVTTTAATADGAIDIDIAVDAVGAVHIAYGQGQSSAAPGLYYATNRTGSWRTNRLSDIATFGVSLGVDPMGEVHMVVGSSGAIDYLTNRKGYFKRLRLAESGAWYPDLALDAARRIHVVYEAQSGSTGIHYVTNAGGSWSDTRLSTGQSGADTRPAITLDPGGPVHVAFARNGTGQGIKHVTNATGSWATTTVSTKRSSDPSIALEGGAPRIAFYSSGVWLATRSGSTWSSARVSESGGWEASLVIVSGGERRIAFEGSSGTILLASSATPLWTINRASTGDDRQPAMVADAHNALHIAWSRVGTDAGIYYRTNAGGSWITTRVTTQQDTQPSIDVDSTGHVYIAFRRDAATWEDSGVFLVTNATGPWVTTRIREGSAPEVYTDTDDYCPWLIVDGQDHVQVVMHDSVAVSAGLYTPTSAHFTNATGQWVRTQITSTSPPNDDAPFCMALAIDSLDHAHVAWLNSGTAPTIKYGTNASGLWVTSSVATQPVGEPSIALSATGKAYIAFGRQYVTNASGAWVKRTILGPAAGVGSRPAIVIRSGKIDLAYYSDGIYYATNRSGSWVASRVASNLADHQVGEGRSMPALVLTSSGAVRIAFSREAVGIYQLAN